MGCPGLSIFFLWLQEFPLIQMSVDLLDSHVGYCVIDLNRHCRHTPACLISTRANISNPYSYSYCGHDIQLYRVFSIVWLFTRKKRMLRTKEDWEALDFWSGPTHEPLQGQPLKPIVLSKATLDQTSLTTDQLRTSGQDIELPMFPYNGLPIVWRLVLFGAWKWH